jgi:hypothetical protein
MLPTSRRIDMTQLDYIDPRRALGQAARLALAIALLLAFAPASSAAGPLVCPQATCTYHKLQDALDIIPRIATITIGAGTYRENLFIDHVVALAGAGQGVTVIQPATSNPNCNDKGGPTFCGNGIQTVNCGGAYLAEIGVSRQYSTRPRLTSDSFPPSIGKARLIATP